MPRNPDFYAALAVGTLLGVGAGLVLRPRPRSARERLLRELRPYREQLQESLAQTRRQRQTASSAGEDLTPAPGLEAEAIQIGRELLSEFREEVRRVLEEARVELSSLAGEQGTGRARRARWEAEGRLERRPGGRTWPVEPEADEEAPYEDDEPYEEER